MFTLTLKATNPEFEFNTFEELVDFMGRCVGSGFTVEISDDEECENSK